MAFLNSTPQEDVQAVIVQTEENAKQAMMWFAVVAAIVLVIVYGSKK